MASLPQAQSTQRRPVVAETPALACPMCHGALQAQESRLVCELCAMGYPVHQGQPDFRLDAPVSEKPTGIELDNTERWQNAIKMVLRRYPALYRFLVCSIGTAYYLGFTSDKFVASLGAQAQVLSIGAGVLRLEGRVTHLDYEPYAHLEVVGDAHYLPFADNSFDGVVCEAMLEHVLEPERVLAEIHRVLKPGGKVYILMPFLFSFHAAPNDFYRWTHKGLAYRMRDFQVEKLLPFSGPASTLNNILVEWCALVFSLGSVRLYRLFSLVFLVLWAPIKFLDVLLCRHPEAMRMASIFLCVARKPEEPRQAGI